jgi:hypothetical protein
VLWAHVTELQLSGRRNARFVDCHRYRKAHLLPKIEPPIQAE